MTCLDLEDPVCNITTVAMLIDITLDGAVIGRKPDIAALYYLVGCLRREADTLKETFYAIDEQP